MDEFQKKNCQALRLKKPKKELALLKPPAVYETKTDVNPYSRFRN